MPEPEDAVIVVTAWGHASATPDTVVISLAVDVSAPTPGEALQQAGERLTALIAVLDEAGVSSEDRRTTGLTVSPRWDERGKESGHQAGYGLEVLARDLASAGDLVQRAAQRVGASLRVHQFGLSVRDPAPHVAEARQAAVRAARVSAEQIAEAADVRLGALVSVVEGGPAPLTGRAMRASGVTMMAESAGPSVEPGRSEFGVQVTATYRLEPQPLSR